MRLQLGVLKWLKSDSIIGIQERHCLCKKTFLGNDSPYHRLSQGYGGEINYRN